jgi:hypothetical protein
MQRLDGIEGLQRVGWQIAKEPVGTKMAIEAALLNCALHVAVIQLL